MQGAPWQTRFHIALCWQSIWFTNIRVWLWCGLQWNKILAGRNSKGKEWERQWEGETGRESERMEGTAHGPALSPINLTCVTCVCVSTGNPTRQFQQTVLWGVVGRKWVGPARREKKKKKNRWKTKFHKHHSEVKSGKINFCRLRYASSFQSSTTSSIDIPTSYEPSLTPDSHLSLSPSSGIQASPPGLCFYWEPDQIICPSPDLVPLTWHTVSGYLACIQMCMCVRLCVSGESRVISWKEEKESDRGRESRVYERRRNIIVVCPFVL